MHSGITVEMATIIPWNTILYGTLLAILLISHMYPRINNGFSPLNIDANFIPIVARIVTSQKEESTMKAEFVKSSISGAGVHI